jgi:hypothetical protein
MARVRVQLLGGATDHGAAVIAEEEFDFRDYEEALKQAARIPWPPRVRSYRILDMDGRELAWRDRR